MNARRFIPCDSVDIVAHPKDVKIETLQKVIVQNLKGNLCRLTLVSRVNSQNRLSVAQCEFHHNCPSILDLRQEFIKAMALAPEISDGARAWAAEQTLQNEMVLAKTLGSTGSQYEIRRGGDGVIYCSCPAWRFRKTCKHLTWFSRSVLGGELKNQ